MGRHTVTFYSQDTQLKDIRAGDSDRYGLDRAFQGFFDRVTAGQKPGRVSQAEFRCLACGHQAHADINAARNILRAGLALQET